MIETPGRTRRAGLFRYVGLAVAETSLRATFELDGLTFVESVEFEGVGPLTAPAATALAQLWFLVAGLSYYKAGAARRVDLGATPVGRAGRALFEAALRDGLGEFSYVNDLPLDDVEIIGGADVTRVDLAVDPERVLIPFGGGIDSVVTSSELATHPDRALFVVSPSGGRFTPLEATASVTGLPVVRATRTLDERILAGDAPFFSGHVPVTTMVTLLAAVAAAASGRGGVAMSNEHSASVANLRWRGRDVNHQWSKSLEAERLIADTVEERVGPSLIVASYLRDRSEVWVAKVFSELRQYHHVFRSCNRAFNQVLERRQDGWCGECDKCLFVNLILAPFLSRADLLDIFGHEPLSDPRREEQLRVLVGAGATAKPFECVGDPGESAVALQRVSELDEWADVEFIRALAAELSPERTFDELLEPEGPTRVPANWLR
jgi:UDP-N-acetyl-alpha-D-muramoyl-L-alanyl-L-glutamate epimerase